MSEKPRSALSPSFHHKIKNGVRKINSDMHRALSLEDDHLLRASGLEAVLHRSGIILKSSAGSADTYALSKEVMSIDGFISHNWSTGRVDKFLALALHFNFCPALIATTAICLMLMLAHCQGILPTIQTVSSITGESQRRPVSCVVFGSLIFPILLWNWNVIRRVLTSMHLQRPVSVFLDKTCIHQTDSALKTKGIQSLAAFILHSKSMIVVYTGTYLHKLWTVYELASFLALHGYDSIILIPTLLPKLFILAYVCNAMGQILAVFALWSQHLLADICKCSMQSQIFISDICKSLSLIPVAVVSRAWTKIKYKLAKEVSLFRVHDATCFAESDRPLVYGNIARFMRACGHADSVASDEDALLAFDRIVQTKVPHCISSSLGSCGFPYKYVVAMYSTVFFKSFDNFAKNIVRGDPMRVHAINLLSFASFLLMRWPLAVELTCRITRVGLDNNIFGDLLVLCAAMVSGSGFLFVSQRVDSHILNHHARQSDVFLWLMLIEVLLLGLAVVYVYGRNFLRACHSRTPDTPESSKRTRTLASIVSIEMAER